MTVYGEVGNIWKMKFTFSKGVVLINKIIVFFTLDSPIRCHLLAEAVANQLRYQFNKRVGLLNLDGSFINGNSSDQRLMRKLLFNEIRKHEDYFVKEKDDECLGSFANLMELNGGKVIFEEGYEYVGDVVNLLKEKVACDYWIINIGNGFVSGNLDLLSKANLSINIFKLKGFQDMDSALDFESLYLDRPMNFIKVALEDEDLGEAIFIVEGLETSMELDSNNKLNAVLNGRSLNDVTSLCRHIVRKADIHVN